MPNAAMLHSTFLKKNPSFSLKNYSDQVIRDDQLMHFIGFNNVLLTSYQAFFAREALEMISEVTFSNPKQFNEKASLKNEICHHSMEYGENIIKGRENLVLR